jgi:hypothetical protein
MIVPTGGREKPILLQVADFGFRTDRALDQDTGELLGLGEPPSKLFVLFGRAFPLYRECMPGTQSKELCSR